MFDNDFGYFGSGIDGYVHYMSSINDSFSDDDLSYDDSFDDCDYACKDINKNSQNLYGQALSSIEFIKKSITTLKEAILSDISLGYKAPEWIDTIDKKVALLKEGISFFKLYKGYSKNKSIVEKHSNDINKFFTYFTECQIKLNEQLIDCLNQNPLLHPDNYLKNKLLKKYANDFKIIDDYIAENF